MAGGRRSVGLSKSCILVIVVASVERFAYKGVVSNLVTYLTDVVKMSNSSAAKSVSNWCGVTSMLPLIGAFLADSYWDQHSTILISSFLYMAGLVALTMSALLLAWTPISKTITYLSLFSSLYLISFAQGGYNPCLQAFGAGQLENMEGEGEGSPFSGIDDGENPNTNNNEKKKSLFFQWWYFGVCTGSLSGVTLMSYIQDTFGWGWGFAIPTIGMAMSIACFSCGTRLFVHRNKSKVVDTPIHTTIQSVKAAARKMFTGSIITFPRRDDTNVVELELQNHKPLRDDFNEPESLDKNSIPTARIQPGDMKAVLRLLPIWAMLLMFAVIFQQPSTFFTKQGMTMKRNIGKDFMIPPATLQSTITISIILLMPFYDKLIIPIFRLITRTDKGINVLQRMGIGIFLSVISMVVAALVESKRLEIAQKVPNITQSSQTETVPLSIFWLVPQYVLLGISDVFTVVGMQEFFYNEVPNGRRTTGIALYLSVFGVGSFLSAILISIIEMVTELSGQKHRWFSDNLAEARLDHYYWLLALLCTVSLFLFVLLSKHYLSSNAL
ncbi:protein NRT1/ PTR FAMILY 5.8-like [Magnolia sinica]|uniref:protein NRT1/ PTR FAMILY 5.8-like n=1 Tax=Magnolia sinica TaxID=86752 RepID=UPI00265A394D|nr:protein NRT1/ PTR FAMILY 5.8-like [Magnolia sinica]